ncbi:FAS1-like dehydratase domain-containing protein [Actinomadura fibrosa]|uniref:MaoC family dehydratase N-terminal domain-containing protein n=1 Tax=Actinomadura fibrosa TaxID=111802 RepID=A0ABW2XXC3_9ACTN|nr:MaoC family dehydratase N-terminal domain-containing protein [Actinomadura fibrosa]
MEAALDVAERRARALVGRVGHRSLGVVRAAEAAGFARAAGETSPCLVDPDDAGFVVHPMYVVSLLRGVPGAGDEEFRPDGMYRDEVPGTDGLDVALMAGGQDVRWIADVRPGDRIDVRRTLTEVARKGRGAGFLLLTVEKTYGTAERGALVEVTERLIVR